MIEIIEKNEYKYNKKDIIRLKNPIDLITKKNPVIYFLIKDNTIVYIGKSIGAHNRINTHLKYSNKKTFDSFSMISIKNESELKQAEKFYIRKFKPTKNRQHNPDIIQPSNNKYKGCCKIDIPMRY